MKKNNFLIICVKFLFLCFFTNFFFLIYYSIHASDPRDPIVIDPGPPGGCRSYLTDVEVFSDGGYYDVNRRKCSRIVCFHFCIICENGYSVCDYNCSPPVFIGLYVVFPYYEDDICYTGGECHGDTYYYSGIDRSPNTPTNIIVTPGYVGPSTTVTVSATVSDPEGNSVKLQVCRDSGCGTVLCTSGAVSSGSSASCQFTASSACSSTGTCTIYVRTIENSADPCGQVKVSATTSASFNYDETSPQNSYTILSSNAYYDSTNKTYYANAGKTFVIQVNSTDNERVKELTFILADKTCSNPYVCDNSIRIRFDGESIYHENTLLFFCKIFFFRCFLGSIYHEKTHPLFRIPRINTFKSSDNKTLLMNITLEILAENTERPITFVIWINSTDGLGNTNLTKFNSTSDHKFIIFNGGLTLPVENSLKISSMNITVDRDQIKVEVNISTQLKLKKGEIQYAISDLLIDDTCSDLYSHLIPISNLDNITLQNKCVKFRYFIEDLAGNMVFKEYSEPIKVRERRTFQMNITIQES